jgi:hypothetical protein
MSKTIGDFNYNGIPMFNVGFSDFYTFIESINSGKRLLSKNIQRDDLREYFKGSRNNNFGVCYEGVMIDMRNNKKK